MRVLRTHPVIPAHSHEGVAEEGDFVNEGKQYRPGTSLHVKTGRLQGPHTTEKGCKILVLGTAPGRDAGSQPSGSGGSIRAIRLLEKSGLNCRILGIAKVAQTNAYKAKSLFWVQGHTIPQ